MFYIFNQSINESIETQGGRLSPTVPDFWPQVFFAIKKCTSTAFKMFRICCGTNAQQIVVMESGFY